MFKLFSLKPREDKFCRFLEQLSAEAGACARHLKTFAESPEGSERESAGQAITASKAAAKLISSQITKELCRTYITPFDREDIQDFALELYKIPKTIEKIKDRLAAHGLTNAQGDFSRQIDLIVQESEAMEEMVKELTGSHDSKRIVAKAAILQNLENKGDAVLGELLVSLFRDNTDARDMILRKDIYDMLEKVIDRYRDAASVALQIVLKHS